MECRHLAMSDWESYTKLLSTSVSREAFEDFLVNTLGEKHVVMVIDLGEEILGGGSLLIERKLTHGGCTMGHVENVVVSAEHRRKGYGARIVAALVALATERGCYRIDLNCDTRLEPFYEGVGFKDSGLHKSVLVEENFALPRTNDSDKQWRRPLAES